MKSSAQNDCTNASAADWSAMLLCSGFLEMGETGEEGAAREAKEELNAQIEVGGLLAVYCLPHIGQV